MSTVFGPPGVIEFNHLPGVTPDDDICLRQTEIFWVALACVFPHLPVDDFGIIGAVSDAVSRLFIDAFAFRMPEDRKIVISKPRLDEADGIYAQRDVAIDPD